MAVCLLSPLLVVTGVGLGQDALMYVGIDLNMWAECVPAAPHCGC